jgi:signal transduction histidine kinase
LQTGVEQLGRGDLAARVAVEGRDEVAALARSFNQSAERIEALMQSHKLLLANCSHELRTPLARIRLGIERLAPSDSAAHEELKRSIAELDSLIEEMLLTRRLDALDGLERTEEVDLLALAAEEAAHFERVAEGQPTLIQGDAHLLRRMIRNLLDNARCYGGGATRIEVGTDAAGLTRLIIEDGGPGIATADLDRIFEPFYRGGGNGTPVRGFGLGLSIVRQIARAHGGDVSYEPIPGGGSRFTVAVRRA